MTNLSKMKMVVVGDVMLDIYFSGEVRRISSEAPVPVVWVRQKNFTLGGAGNVALNLARLGCRVDVFGIRGDDVQGRKMSAILQNNGIKDRLFVDRSHITTTKTRIIVERQQLIRLDDEETWKCGKTSIHRLLKGIEKTIKTADGVILSDYSKGVLMGDVPQHVIGFCNKNRKPVFVDPKGKAWERYRGATCITPNIVETEEISGTIIGYDRDKLAKEAGKLRKKYDFKYLLATRGREGMCLFGHGSAPIFISSAAREVFDVSGAGDTVIATFAASVSSGIPVKIAAEIANIAAGIVVGKVGSQPITKLELEFAWKSREAGLYANTHKISTVHSAQLQIQTWKAAGEKVVLTHGFFDGIHPGHIHRLSKAKDSGNRLVVVLYPGKYVQNYKSKSLRIFSQKERAEIISALQCVDLVILLDQEPVESLFEKLKPNVFVKRCDDLLSPSIENKYVLRKDSSVEVV